MRKSDAILRQTNVVGWRVGWPLGLLGGQRSGNGQHCSDVATTSVLSGVLAHHGYGSRLIFGSSQLVLVITAVVWAFC